MTVKHNKSTYLAQSTKANVVQSLCGRVYHILRNEWLRLLLHFREFSVTITAQRVIFLRSKGIMRWSSANRGLRTSKVVEEDEQHPKLIETKERAQCT